MIEEEFSQALRNRRIVEYIDVMVFRINGIDSFKVKFIAVSGRKLLLNGYSVIFRTSWIYNILVRSMPRYSLIFFSIELSN